jgi:hypothetical protein
MADDFLTATTAALPDDSSRRHQMFPVLAATDIERMQRFGKVLRSSAAIGCWPRVKQLLACLWF